MEAVLTDKEFIRLTRMLLISHSLPEARGHVVYNIIPIDQKLIDQKLLQIEYKQIAEKRTIEYMTLTLWGYYVLTQQGLRLVLCLLKLGAVHPAMMHMSDLKSEELPILLTHNDSRVRVKAAEVMRFRNQSEEELWKIFTKRRGQEA